jgi:4-amino-4-deoxy-L-arabinose transferase-like glycosyltransferase
MVGPVFNGPSHMSILTDNSRSLWPRGLAALLDYASASHARALAFLLLVSLVAFVPGTFQLPPIDREESRFAQATKQMIETGDFVDIRFQDDVRYSKPVGLYWLQAAVVKTAQVIGVPRALTRIGLYRLPSLLGAIGAVLVTYWAALAFVSRRGAILAAAMLAASILLGVIARLAVTDAMLLAATTAAMGAMARAYRQQARGERDYTDWTLPAIFWTALAGGVLLKGPIILIFVVLAALTLSFLDRSARWLLALRPLLGIAWFVLLVAPWLIAISLRTGRFFFVESLGEDMLGRIANVSEYRFVPPGVYLLLFFVAFWPASLMAALAAPAIWRTRQAPPTRFLLAWLIPSWLLFELIWAKLPHFVLPLYPAIAILIAGCIETYQLSQNRWLVRGTFWWFGLPVLMVLAGLVFLIRMEGELGFLAWPFAVAAMIFGFRAWWLYDNDGAERAVLRACAASILLSLAIYAVMIPSLRSVFPSDQVARAVRNAGCPNPEVASAGFHEPSVVFLLGTPTQLTDGAGAAEFLRRGGCRLAVVEARHERSFAVRADALGLRYARSARIEATNLVRGHPMLVTIYRSEERP